MNEELSSKPAGLKLLLLLLIAFASVLVFSFIALLLMPLFGYEMLDTSVVLADPGDQKAINALKFMQLMNALGFFVLPPLLFAFLVAKNKFHYLCLHQSGKLFFFIVVPVIMFSSMPLINLMAELNRGLELPEFMKGIEEWIKSSEEKAEGITRAFLNVDDIPGLLYNLLLIAVIPAIGEELLFRGALQRLIIESTKNVHIGIWIAGIVFSALHFQFYGFLPRMMMGVLFGYMLLWSGSLWVPIFAHFMNNATAVVLSFLVHTGRISADIEHIGEGEGALYYNITSFFIVAGLLTLLYINRDKSGNNYKAELEDSV
jgi:uncharacterized protein